MPIHYSILWLQPETRRDYTILGPARIKYRLGAVAGVQLVQDGRHNRPLSQVEPNRDFAVDETWGKQSQDFLIFSIPCHVHSACFRI
jgi:hypothetical protein